MKLSPVEIFVYGLVGGTSAVLVTALITSCGASSQQASATAQLACTLIEAQTNNATVASLCATAPELAAIAASVMASRDGGASGSPSSGDAGARKLERCRQVPSTDVCATDDELVAGIVKVKASRK